MLTGATRIPYNSERGRAKLNSLRRKSKPFRGTWLSGLDIDEKLRNAFEKRGLPDEREAIRGVKQCFQCNMIWHRDLNAARNMAILFVYLRYHALKRPFYLQRFKNSSGKSDGGDV